MNGEWRIESCSQLKRRVLLAVMVALAVSFYAVEALLPAFVPVPGAKLGLANLVTLCALYWWGPKEALLVLLARQMIGTLIAGTFFTPAFILGLGGGLVSLLVMTLVLKLLPNSLSVISVSVVGGVSHNLGQLLLALILTGHPGILAYYPFLVVTGMISGMLIGLVGRYLMTAMAKAKVLPAGGCELSVPPGFARLDAAFLSSFVVVAALGGVLLLTPSNILKASASPGEGETGLVAVVRVEGEEVLRVPLFVEEREGTYHVAVNGAGSRGTGVSGPRGSGSRASRGKSSQGAIAGAVIEIRNGRVRVADSSCPDKVCVHTGWISQPGEVIVCLPNRLSVEVVSTCDGAVKDYGAERYELDAVTR